MILEKVYDELYGMIEDLKKKVGKGGSVVTITPTLQSGEKLADYSIDGTDGSIYAPAVPGIALLESEEQSVSINSGNNIIVSVASLVTIPQNYSIAAVTTIVTGANSSQGVWEIIGKDGFISDPAVLIKNPYSSTVTWTYKVKVIVMENPITTENTKTKKKK